MRCDFPVSLPWGIPSAWHLSPISMGSYNTSVTADWSWAAPEGATCFIVCKRCPLPGPGLLACPCKHAVTPVLCAQRADFWASMLRYNGQRFPLHLLLKKSAVGLQSLSGSQLGNLLWTT